MDLFYSLLVEYVSDINFLFIYIILHFFFREKILRLEHENKMLKLKSSGDNDEQSQVLQTMLDDANSRKNELETEIR